MGEFNLQTASLADLWAALNFIKSEIELYDAIKATGIAPRKAYDLDVAAVSVREEIRRRMDAFIQPPIKA